MAFTKTPEYNTHQLQRVPIDLEGRFDPERIYYSPDFANCFPVLKKSEVVVTRRAPVTEVNSFSGTVPRGLCFDPNNSYLYVAYDDDLKVYTDLNPVAVTSTAAVFAGSTGKISFGTYKVGSISYVIAHETGASSNLYYWSSGVTGAPSASTNVAVANMCPSLVIMDGYLFIAGGDGGSTQRIYNSDIGDPTVFNISTDFVDAEMETDQIQAITKHHNHIVAFGKESVEFFYNAANEIGSPLSRQANYSQKIGLTEFENSDPPIVEIGDVIYFLGGASGAYNGIYKIENFKVEKISDLWLDSLLTIPNGIASRLGVYEHLGQACLALMPVFRDTFIYKPDTKTWSSVDTLANSFYSVFGSFFDEGGAYFLTKDIVAATIYLYKSGWRGPQSLSETTQTVSSFYRSQQMDFGNNNQKHVKWVDVVGNFRTNAVTLSYTSDLNLSASGIGTNTRYQSVDGSQHPVRFRNLGRTRGHRYDLVFNGNTDFEFRGLEIAYNGGTY
jgi:hypothetical protein